MVKILLGKQREGGREGGERRGRRRVERKGRGREED
jgi:hypothetical protein